jgi:dolichol kinase
LSKQTSKSEEKQKSKQSKENKKIIGGVITGIIFVLLIIWAIYGTGQAASVLVNPGFQQTLQKGMGTVGQAAVLA